MFEKIEALTHSEHQNLRFSNVSGFDFAKDLSVAKVAFSEMRQASFYYPVIFREADASLPALLLSLEEGQTPYVGQDKQWKVPYVPMSVRLYPFTLARVEDDPGKMVLCIDPGAPHFASGQGAPLYTEDGQLTDSVRGVLNALEKYQKELAVTERMVKLLSDNELIVPRQYNYQVKGQLRKIDGFWGVDMKKLTQKEETILAELVKTGAFSLVHEHVHSLNNFLRLIPSGNRGAKG